MIVGGQTEARAQLSSTIIDYHEPFDQGFKRSTIPGEENQFMSQKIAPDPPLKKTNGRSLINL